MATAPAAACCFRAAKGFMSDNEMRIAIAEHDGWRKVKTFHWSEDGKTRLPKQYMVIADLPNFPEDLNACHEFENQFHSDYPLQHEYVRHLGWISLREKHSGQSAEFARINATARQRCEAFLKAVGKWKE